jgi:carbon monoxide dehydrogenase subunit G
MKLEQSFTVQAAVEEVWAALIDVERVAPCLPGAEITEVGEDGTYHGLFTIKLGPTTAAYRGTLKMEDIDEAGRRATMNARGTDKRGQGGVTATIVSFMTADGDGTRVEVDTDFTITGRLARFGRGGMIEDVSKRLLGDFAACLQASLAAEGAAGAAAPAGAAPAPAPAAAAGAGPDAAAAPPPTTSGSATAAETPAPPRHHAPPAKPLNALRLLLQVLWDRIRRLWARLGARLRGHGS